MMGSNAIDELLNKYGLPSWIKPYVYSYVRSNPLRTIKHASSFIDVGRKKGIVTRNEIRMPNGHVFQKNDVMRVLDLFYYGEERASRISEKWADESANLDWKYTKHFKEIAGVEARHARAIRNVIEGLGHKVELPSRKFVEVFDFVERLEDWNERLIAKKIVFWYSYRYSFGLVFYKVFYPVAPEFLRSLGNIFKADEREELLGENEIGEIIASKKISEERLTWLVRQLLARIYVSIQTEMPLARKAKVEKEAQLLCDIAIASPIHVLKDMGVNMDVKKELREMKHAAKALRVP